MTIAEKLALISENTPKVFEAGCDHQVAKAIWDAFLGNGERTTFEYAFAQTKFTKETFKPTHDIRPTGSVSRMFMNSRVDGGPLKMKDVEEQNGMVFDFSNCTSFTYAFANCLFDELNVIDLSKSTSSGANGYAFYGGYHPTNRIKKINRLIFGENTDFSSTTFQYCDALEYIGAEGVIGQSGLNLSACKKLLKASITSIINALSTTTSGLTVTLSKAAVDKAFETASGSNDGSTSEEWLALRGTRSNWTIVLA